MATVCTPWPTRRRRRRRLARGSEAARDRAGLGNFGGCAFGDEVAVVGYGRVMRRPGPIRQPGGALRDEHAVTAPG